MHASTVYFRATCVRAPCSFARRARSLTPLVDLVQRGVGINIRPNPVIYNSVWSRHRHMCGHGTANAYEFSLEKRLALFKMCASYLPRAVMTTFWSHSWVASSGGNSSSRNSTRIGNTTRRTFHIV